MLYNFHSHKAFQLAFHFGLGGMNCEPNCWASHVSMLVHYNILQNQQGKIDVRGKQSRIA